VITPRLFFGVAYDKLVLPWVITVIDMEVIDSFARVFDGVWSDGMSAGITTLFAHADSEDLVVFAVVLHRIDQQVQDFGRFQLPGIASKTGKL
jgi:hypothetical protein